MHHVHTVNHKTALFICFILVLKQVSFILNLGLLLQKQNQRFMFENVTFNLICQICGRGVQTLPE